MKIKQTKGDRSGAIITRTPREVYTLWIKALRSGKYVQARNHLRQNLSRGYGYCCLGVLCDLASKDGGPKWKISKIQGKNFHDWGGNVSWLSEKARKYLQLTGREEMKLIVMNDKEGKSFKEIASHIQTLRDKKFP